MTSMAPNGYQLLMETVWIEVESSGVGGMLKRYRQIRKKDNGIRKKIAPVILAH